MKQLVMQQLGDKSNFDSKVLETEHLTGPNAKGEKPLENLIKEALDYDSVCYRQALGIDLKQPNGVTKSQEYEKLR
jgi:hypothetical protein